ncbi:MAG: hypothetical protein BGO98_09165 [Myxococcales bacterium 68-20]|nr:MAG: hypothetical protein BGO98_09165 [Myxococcales bacterium 68-20]
MSPPADSSNAFDTSSARGKLELFSATPTRAEPEPEPELELDRSPAHGTTLHFALSVPGR